MELLVLLRLLIARNETQVPQVSQSVNNRCECIILRPCGIPETQVLDASGYVSDGDEVGELINDEFLQVRAKLEDRGGS